MPIDNRQPRAHPDAVHLQPGRSLMRRSKSISCRTFALALLLSLILYPTRSIGAQAPKPAAPTPAPKKTPAPPKPAAKPPATPARPAAVVAPPAAPKSLPAD